MEYPFSTITISNTSFANLKEQNRIISYDLKIVLFVNYVASTFPIERGEIPDFPCLV